MVARPRQCHELRCRNDSRDSGLEQPGLCDTKMAYLAAVCDCHLDGHRVECFRHKMASDLESVHLSG